MKHKELVILAGRWLQWSKGCNPVFIEKGSPYTEIPDAIGWNSYNCIVVECKTSKQDLLANSKKELKLGSLRYMFMIPELYKECENIIPEKWGVVTTLSNESIGFKDLRVSFSVARQVRFKNSKIFERNYEAEASYLKTRVLNIQRYGTV